ncbi:hypothetical protein [Burkholderia cenocepacia]|uniref:hypothetical protein n=1 Tax=Burkholderia cenocepacia TaxID=95486 RepID=UPI0006785EE0|nr:hypothetical protein [Burkholderia cenocepacia]KWU26766.1 hypothetical protein AS149_05445 [Burkholderia cenocepacia]
MKKTLIAAVLVGLALSACGGGDDSSPPAASGPAIRLTYSGVPLGTTKRARAMAAATDVSSAASAPSASTGDAQSTVAALQDAFKARGAEIGVYPGVIDGTALHQLVMAEGNGVGPTIDEIAKANVNISEWVLVNFALDDMTGYIDTADKEAKFTQFVKDLQTYAGREYLKGRVVFAALPNVSCAPAKVVRSVDENGYVTEKKYVPTTEALYFALTGSWGGGLQPIGGILKTDPAHMGADCETPDQVAKDAYLASIVDPLVERYKTALDTINKCKYNPEAIPENGRSAQCWGIEPVKK